MRGLPLFIGGIYSGIYGEIYGGTANMPLK